MRRKPGIRLAAVIAVAAFCATTAGGQSVAPSLWMVNPKFADSPALLLGIRGECSSMDEWRAGGHLYAGNMDYGGGNEYLELDGELRLSRGWRWLDNAGVGCRLEKWGDGEQEIGPMVYAGFRAPIKDTPWGWHASASWMFFGLVGDYESEHLNTEIGLSWTKGDWQAQLGYRKKFYYGQEEDPAFSGPVFSVAFNFGEGTGGKRPRPKPLRPAPDLKPSPRAEMKNLNASVERGESDSSKTPAGEDLYVPLWKKKMIPEKSAGEEPGPKVKNPRPATAADLDAPVLR